MPRQSRRDATQQQVAKALQRLAGRRCDSTFIKLANGMPVALMLCPSTVPCTRCSAARAEIREWNAANPPSTPSAMPTEPPRSPMALEEDEELP
jgi:hypothetical protein